MAIRDVKRSREVRRAEPHDRAPHEGALCGVLYQAYVGLAQMHPTQVVETAHLTRPDGPRLALSLPDYLPHGLKRDYIVHLLEGSATRTCLGPRRGAWPDGRARRSPGSGGG